jgi:hypothetical protein
MNKLMIKTKRTFMRALVASTALAAAGSTFADTIYDNFTGYSDFWHSFGYPDTATYGETFRAPTNGDVNLQDFGFYMGSPSASGNILLRAYIATWTGTHAGTLLYTSADYDFANTGDDHLTFTTGGLTLTPGVTYVAFLSVSELYCQSSGSSYVSQGDPTIPGGNFVWYNNGSDFGALFANNWDNTGAKPDWAFNATFTAGSGDALTLEATIHRQGGRRFVALTWSPADGGTVNVLRNGDVIATTDDDGEVRDSLGTGTGIFIYQVCETDSGDCSNAVRVKVGGTAD